MHMEQQLFLTPHAFAGYYVQALLMFAERRKAMGAAIAREQAATLWELSQWERLAEVLLDNTVGAFFSNASSGTPHTSTQDNSLGSGVSFGAGNKASGPVFRAPPGLQSSTHSLQIPEEFWKLLPPEVRCDAYYAGRACRQRRRRHRLKSEQRERRAAQAGQDAPYQ